MVRNILTITKHDLRILRRDLATPIFLTLMPLLLITFMKPLFRLALQDAGYRQANGSEYAVPGMAVVFTSFFVAYVGLAFFREHGWNTWERLRASPVAPVEIIVGKTLPVLGLSVLQLAVLFGVGIGLLGLEVTGSLVALVLVGIATSCSLLSFGVMATALSRTSQQLNAMGMAAAMVFGSLGGAFIPFALMPGWAKPLGPITPTYWAMRGFRMVILDGQGVLDLALPVGVLLAFTAGFLAIAAGRFRFDETKIYYG